MLVSSLRKLFNNSAGPRSLITSRFPLEPCANIKASFVVGPLGPSNVQASVLNSSAVRITWSAPTGGVTVYELEYNSASDNSNPKINSTSTDEIIA